jgi:hypothetical protein
MRKGFENGRCSQYSKEENGVYIPGVTTMLLASRLRLAHVIGATRSRHA